MLYNNIQKNGFNMYAITLNDNKIYIHWNDFNEIVDHLWLLEVSRQADHNGQNNEILSIIEELRKASLMN